MLSRLKNFNYSYVRFGYTYNPYTTVMCELTILIIIIHSIKDNI